MSREQIVQKKAGINRWWTVLGGALGTAVGAGIVVVYCFGVFVDAIATEFNWQPGVLSFAVSCFLITTGFGTILLGFLINKYNIKYPSAVFVLFFAVSVCVLSILPDSPILFYLTFAGMGLFGAAATALPYSVSISEWFDRRRGLALGMMIAGGGFGSFLAPRLSNYLLGEYGWRTSLLIIGTVAGIVGVLSMLLLVKNARQRTQNIAVSNQASIDEVLNFMKQREFVFIAIGIFGVSVATFGVLATLVPLLEGKGFSKDIAVAILSIAGLASWGNKFVTGWALDRFQAKHVAAVVFMATLAGVLIIAFGDSSAQMYLGAALVGLGLGAEADLVTYLISRYFPLTHFSRLLGVLWVTWAWGGGAGTAAAGYSHNMTGNYFIGLMVMSVVLIVSTVAVLCLGPYKYPPEYKKPT